MHVAAAAYFFLIGFAVCFFEAVSGFPAAGVAVFFAAEFVECGFGITLAPDFDAVGVFDFVTGFATFLAADAAGFVGCVDFPEVVTALTAAAGFPGATCLDGSEGTDFLPASTLSCLEASLAAGGLFGFLFGGNCSSAKRAITSAMPCSVSA